MTGQDWPILWVGVVEVYRHCSVVRIGTLILCCSSSAFSWSTSVRASFSLFLNSCILFLAMSSLVTLNLCGSEGMGDRILSYEETITYKWKSRGGSTHQYTYWR